MNKDNIQAYITFYFNQEKHIFNFSSNYMSKYICLEEIIVLGSLELFSNGISSRHAETTIYVDMFMKSGGVYHHIVRSGVGVEITELDKELYEALRLCWLQCKTPTRSVNLGPR